MNSPMLLTTEQKQAIDHGRAVALNVEGRECVLISRDAYQRVQSAVLDDLPSLDEQRRLLRSLGEMAGWDDADMNVYDAT